MEKSKKEFLDKHINTYFTPEQVIIVDALVKDVVFLREKLAEVVDRMNEQTNTINALIEDNRAIAKFLNKAIELQKEDSVEVK